MKKPKIHDGDILRIPLLNKFGYAYAKYIDLRNQPNLKYPALLKFFDYWTKIKEFEIDKIKHSDYLIQPMLVAGILATLRNGLWEVIGNLENSEDDYKINDFKAFGPPWAKEIDAKKWYAVVNGDIDNKIETSFENVKHLEKWGAQGTGTIEIRLSIQLLLKEGLDVTNYLDLENEKINDEYKKAIEIPLLAKIPLQLRGKAIE